MHATCHVYAEHAHTCMQQLLTTVTLIEQNEQLYTFYATFMCKFMIMYVQLASTLMTISNST